MPKRKAGGTDFWIVLDPPPREDYYVTNSDVTGNLMVVTDKEEPDYKSIEITLSGHAFVLLIERTTNAGTGRSQIETRTSCETYAGENAVVWSKPADDAPGENLKFTTGSHTLPFSLKFNFSAPASFQGSHGRIFYLVEARITDIKDDIVKVCKSVPIRFVPFVDLNSDAYAMKPMIMQVSW